MTTSEPNLRLTEDTYIEPEPTGDVRTEADEQFIHGLLLFLHLDSRGEQQRRINRVMQEIRRSGRTTIRHHILSRASNRAILAAAACVALVATLAWLGIPTEQSAQAMVQASIEATKNAGPRRYEVRAEIPHWVERRNNEDQPGDAEGPPLQRIAVIDINDAQHVLIRTITPRGRLIVGRNEQGEWAIRPDGEIERFDAQRAWPRWIEMNGESVLLESVDALLEQLKPNYDVFRAEAEAEIDNTLNAFDETEVDATKQRNNHPGRKFDRILAKKIAGPPHLPQNIMLWIHPESHIVQRMELQWGDEPMRRERAGDDDRMRDWREQRRLRNERAGPIGPDRDAAPPPPGELGPDRMPPDDGVERPRRPMLDRMRRNQPGMRDGAGPPPPGIGDGEFRGEGLDGELPQPPRFLDGPPRFRDGKDRPPPRIIIQLIETPEFEDGWFDPESHVR